MAKPMHRLGSHASAGRSDQELVAHGAVPPLDFPASLRLSGLLCTSSMPSTSADRANWCELYAAPLSQYSRAGQPRVLTASCSTACTLSVSKPWPDRVPRVVVELREQHRAAALDDRAVQPAR
jgi:hypothetical protein